MGVADEQVLSFPPLGGTLITIVAKQTTNACPQCCTDNPNSNKFCGNCGGALATTISLSGQVKKGFSGGYFLFAGLVLVGICLYFVMTSTQSSATAQTTPPAETPTVERTPTAEPPLPAPGSQWEYSKDQDAMGRARSFAFVQSMNALEFNSPYSGIQRGALRIRKKGTTDVMVTIERGQFLCGIENCTINIRFDDGAIQHFTASGPSDQSTTVLFIEDVPLFLSKLRKAKTVNIEATFYQEGSQTLEFNVEGFKPL